MTALKQEVICLLPILETHTKIFVIKWMDTNRQYSMVGIFYAKIGKRGKL